MWSCCTFDLAGKKVKKVCVDVRVSPGTVCLVFIDDPEGAELKVELKPKTVVDMVRRLEEVGVIPKKNAAAQQPA